MLTKFENMLLYFYMRIVQARTISISILVTGILSVIIGLLESSGV